MLVQALSEAIMFSSIVPQPDYFHVSYFISIQENDYFMFISR